MKTIITSWLLSTYLFWVFWGNSTWFWTAGPLDRDTGDQPQPLDLGKAVYVMLTVNVRENVSLLTFWKDDLNDWKVFLCGFIPAVLSWLRVSPPSEMQLSGGAASQFGQTEIWLGHLNISTEKIVSAPIVSWAVCVFQCRLGRDGGGGGCCLLESSSRRKGCVFRCGVCV